MRDNVVITGTGMISSLGHSPKEVWDALLSGKSGIAPIKDFDAGGFDCRVAAQVNGLDPSAIGIHPRDARIMDKHSFMLMKSSHDAFKDAKLDEASISGEEIGFFAGMGMVDYNVEDLIPAILKSRATQGGIDYDRFFSEGYQEIYPLWPLSMLNNISFCQVAISLDIRGENSVFSPHADSGAQVVSEAVESLIEKKTKAVLAGGVSERVLPSSLARAHLSGTLNITDGDNETACRPFSADRKGTVMGEGCGVVALELRSSADKRGIPYTAVVTGRASTFGLESGSPAPSADAISSSMRTAMGKAGIKASDIDVIIANGDGTSHGDRNEIEAVNNVFSDSMDEISVYSSKGALGHMYAGAPAVDMILAVYMLEHGVIPPTLNSEPIDKSVKFRLGTGEPLMKKTGRVMINCQSYEGQTASLIIEKT
jgi:3-oxoacyl-(acyl-carrier-protein) synthase